MSGAHRGAGGTTMAAALVPNSGVWMNQEQKRPMVVLIEEGDRRWRVCGFPTMGG
jgi:hypothetical protein